MDLFPTVCEAAAAPQPTGLDAVSFLPTLLGSPQSAAERSQYFVRREGGALYEGKTIEALIRGGWKLVQDSPFAPLQVFNLRTDPEETKNVAGNEPEVFKALSAELRRQVQRGGTIGWQKPDAPRPE